MTFLDDSKSKKFEAGSNEGVIKAAMRYRQCQQSNEYMNSDV